MIFHFHLTNDKLSDLAQAPHFLVLEVLVDVAGEAGGGGAFSHDQYPILTGLRVDPVEPDTSLVLYPLHCLDDNGHLCLCGILFYCSVI